MFLDDKPQGEVTEAPATTLKLSEAIRIGARLRPPVKNTMRFFDDCGSCALGAAYQAITGIVLPDVEDGGMVAQFFIARGVPALLLGTICGWFHEHKSREHIADLVAAKGY